MYLQSYHDAVTHIIKYGVHDHMQDGRDKIAKALLDLRATKGRKRATRERNHMLGICGTFPDNIRRYNNCR